MTFTRQRHLDVLAQYIRFAAQKGINQEDVPVFEEIKQILEERASHRVHYSAQLVGLPEPHKKAVMALDEAREALTRADLELTAMRNRADKEGMQKTWLSYQFIKDMLDQNFRSCRYIANWLNDQVHITHGV
jgi:hypothetical protein